ncbi:MAG: ABC transporter ATP-binding protein [Defluviitaleaceae bacterium]|nr:ABC transporter ATP-binding protein [Defluviitaleaceae bacterium]
MMTLEAQNVFYRYKKAKYAINDLSLSFEKGCVHVLLGESGAGKTTLLSLLAGLDVCREGRILYNGTDLSKINRDKYRAKNVGVIFQQFNLLHKFNAIENVLVSMAISKYKVDNKELYVENLLDSLGIDGGKRRRKSIELSGGEQQRVAIARALSHNPEIIIADEPTGSLDEANQRSVMEILARSAHRDGKCVIVATHSPEVAKYADHTFSPF